MPGAPGQLVGAALTLCERGMRCRCGPLDTPVV